MSLDDILKKFPRSKILIVGDLILDRFIRGDAKRISPESPVPVVDVRDETYHLGGAGNVANNIISLGGKVFLAGIVGNDYPAEILLKEFKKAGIDAGGVFSSDAIKTSIKTRVIAGHQQVVRFDKETLRGMPPAIADKVIQYVSDKMPQCDAVLISDYGKNVVTQELIREVIKSAKKYKKTVTVDPKIEHFSRYQFVDCLTPNVYEAAAGMGVAETKNKKDFENLGKNILKKLKCRSVLITQGEAGMTLFEKSKITHIPTTAKEVFDVTGAGDTVIAVLTLALSCGAPLISAARLANYAAGIVVGKLGTATVSRPELLKSLR